MSFWRVGFNLKFDLPRYLLPEMSDQVVEAAESSRRRKQWRQIAVQDVPSDQSLRVTAADSPNLAERGKDFAQDFEEFVL
jgi:hypothetical protein